MLTLLTNVLMFDNFVAAIIASNHMCPRKQQQLLQIKIFDFFNLKCNSFLAETKGTVLETSQGLTD